MPAIGMGLVWAGYTLGVFGYCLIRGYDVTFGQLINPVHLLDWKTATAQIIPNTQVLPGKAQPTSSAAGQGGCKDGSSPDQKTGKCADGSNPVIVGPQLA